MKVVLIYVGVGVAGFNPNRLPGDREGSWIHHGVASVGASVRAAGHDVSLIDLRHLSGWDELAKRVAATPADCYGLSVSSVDSQFAPMIAQMVKFCHPQARVVVGGIHPSIFPDQYAACEEIDTVVIGEGEKTLPKLLEKIDVLWPKRVVGEKPNLAEIPWVDRELFDYRRELECFFAPDQETPSITMLAGRGCPYHCTYCQPAENAVFGKPFRIRPTQDVIDELVHLQGRYHFKSITFWDDTFTFDKRWVNDFCDKYEQQKFGASITACSRADIICRNEEMVERLASIGLDWFVIGFESGSQRILNFIKKGTTVEKNKQAAKICRKYGIKIFGTYMYGLPTETREEALETAHMIDEIQPEHPSPFFFLPIEGTEIHRYCKENDLILNPDRTIERTGVFTPTIKGVDYGFLNEVRGGLREIR